MIKVFTTRITPFDLERRVFAWLPDDWQSSGRRYPVIYMFDGHNLFYDETATYGSCWGLKEYHEAHPGYIVVGVDCNHTGNFRLVEYCPYNIRTWGGIHGTGKVYMDWLVHEFKPYIDSIWPTRPERAYTAIAGSSMGGLMSVYAMAAYGDVFSKAACLSPTLHVCLPALLEDIGTVPFPGATRVYISWGERESRSGRIGIYQNTSNALTVARALQVRGAEVWPYLQPNGDHSERSWGAQVPQYMKFLFGRNR